MTNIGLIGAGAMGHAMALHLLKAGQHLTVFIRRPEARNELRELTDLGATLTESLNDLGGCDTVISNVTGTGDVLGRVKELAPAMKAGALWIDHSTIAPEGAATAAKILEHYGIEFVDAPVSGGEAGARAGTLVAMVGGNAARAAHVFSPYVTSYTPMGAVGSGQVAKLCNQIAQVINIQGIAEAMQFADLHGVNRTQVLQAISGGMAGSRMLDLMGPKMAAGDFTAGIQNRLHEKDLGIALDTLKGVYSPALAATHAQLEELKARNQGQLDTSALVTLLGGTLDG